MDSDWFQKSKEHAEEINSEIDRSIRERSAVALRESVKSAITINGAAAVSILGFIGGVASKNATGSMLKIPPLQPPLLVFALGVVVAALSYLLVHFYEERHLEIFDKAVKARNFDYSCQRNLFDNLAACAVGCSLVLFLAGCVWTAKLLTIP